MKKAFTLIELLVVIAIIAILAAILFPVFAQAKVAAKKTGAISNAKQLGLGQIMYMNDYDDTFVLYFSGVVYSPTGGFAGTTSPSIYWPETISPYVQKANHEAGFAQAMIQDLSGIFVDPIKGYSKQDNTWQYGNITSWGMSDDIVSWYAPHTVNANYYSVNASAVTAPAGTAMMVETWDYYSPNHNLPGCALARSYFDNNTSTINGAMRFLDSPYNASYKKTTRLQEPDPNGFNVTAFADGHAKSVTTVKLTHDGNMWSIGGNDQWP